MAVAGAIACLCTAVVMRQGMLLGSHSPLLWGVAAVGLLSGVMAGGVALRASEAWIEALLASGAEFFRRTSSTSEGSCQWAGGGLILLGSLLFATNVVWVYQHQDPPDDDDQSAFLIDACGIHDRGGWAGLWRDLWSGRYEESNRHPLLPALLSWQPTLAAGRVVTCLLAALSWGVVLPLVWRRMGPLTAGVLAVLLGTNGAWLFHAPRVVCESLLTGLAGWAWLLLWQEARRDAGGREGEELAAEPSVLSPPRAALFGVVLGLAYLTKGTGLLLLAGAVLGYGVLGGWSRSERHRAIACAAILVGTFLVTSSPLLVRNQIRFGSATYNINSYLLWVDAYESPNAMAERMTLPEARAEYLATHSVTDLFQREATGLAWEAFIGLRSLGPAPWDDARVLFGLPLFALGLLGLCHTPRLPALVLVNWTGIVWVMMAWYVPIAAGDRFVMPLLIPWLALAANGLVRLVSMSRAPHVASRRIVFAAILWGIVTTVLVWTRSQLWAC